MNKFIPVLTILLLITISATINDPKDKPASWERPEVVFPEGNPLTEESIALGSSLFSEVLLSKDTTISCQSCHMRQSAFADHLTLGEGIKGRHVTRNTPTLFNIGLHPYFMMDGKFATLEEQVLGPINDHREFDMSPTEVVERLKSVAYYNQLSQEAYQSDLTIEVVQKALANFQRIIASDNSRFDQFKRGQIDLSAEELKGWELFNSSDLNCIKCHGGYNFTNYAFENNGLYSTYSDSGRAFVTKEPKDLARFKVPSLRNIALTYPYMHDGSFQTLEAVVDHYAKGGKGHDSQSELVNGFSLSSSEKQSLIAFLRTLTEIHLLE